jgi:tetratricopeptide (TPR) repeat protein
MSREFEEFQRLLRGKNFAEAALFAERESLRNGPTPDPFWLTQQATALARTGQHGAALAAARRALVADPSNPFGIIAAADSLLGLDRMEEALSHYREALAFPRVTRRAKEGILDCLTRMRRFEKTMSLLAEWALPEEESAPWKVKALTGLGRKEEAMTECRKWLARVPHHPPALWALAELEVEHDGIEAVIDSMERAVRIPSLPPVYREIYASLCRKAGRQETALKEYEKLGSQGTGFRARRQQAFLLAKTGKEREAIPLLEELMRGDPADMYLHSSYEAACKRIGETERAVNFYNTLLGLHPEARSLHGRITKLRRALERSS